MKLKSERKMKKITILLGVYLLVMSICCARHIPLDHTNRKDLANYSTREKKFNRAVDVFVQSKDFSQWTLYDLLYLIELEISTVDFLLSGPTYKLKKIIEDKKKYIHKALPKVQKIFKLSVAIAEIENKELEGKNKDEYLRAMRVSLKRIYGKMQALEDRAENKGSMSYETLTSVPDALFDLEPTDQHEHRPLSSEQRLEMEMKLLREKLKNIQSPYMFQPITYGVPIQVIQPATAYQAPLQAVPQPVAQAPVAPTAAQTDKQRVVREQVQKLEAMAKRFEKRSEDIKNSSNKQMSDLQKKKDFDQWLEKHGDVLKRIEKKNEQTPSNK